MIISASRRTDIPAFFTGWFMNRIREQCVYVRNPVNAHQVSKISLHPDVVDCIVFWSKNPAPMLPRLHELREYTYYFQFTLNAYPRTIEKNLPSLEERLYTFQQLSELLGSQRMIWRYDPIFINKNHPVSWHAERFSYLAEALCGYTQKCTVSFIDRYAKSSEPFKRSNIREVTPGEKLRLAKALSTIAHKNGLALETCAEDIELSRFGIGHASCIDGRLVGTLLGCPVSAAKDKNQRPACGCAASIDIGAYNTCPNGCVYCYANHTPFVEISRVYDENSPLLCSRLTGADILSERKMESIKETQCSLFF